VLHLHDYDYGADYARRPAWMKRAVQRMFQGADQVVVLGQRDYQLATALLASDPKRVTILSNCVPDPGPRPEPGSKPPLILFLGRLSARKGVPELLTALAHPAMQALEWSAVLAGDGPLEEYAAQAAEMGLSGRVRMPGWLGQDDVRKLCAGADILVLPSRAEGLAMAVIEGLANGIAVVTTRVGAHEEVITDGLNGLFVPVGDPDALALAIAGLIADPARKSALASRGRETFLERFDMADYMSRLQPVYDRASEALPTLRPTAEGERA
jgi:glycosyltransferase involved in cell wall biosynthesis